MRVAGVDLPAGAVAELALRLRDAGETDLAHRVGVAVDTNTRELQLNAPDRAAVLLVLAGGPATLVDLRFGLVMDELSRQRRTMRRLTADLHQRAVAAARHRNTIYAAACQNFEQARRLQARMVSGSASRGRPCLHA